MAGRRLYLPPGQGALRQRREVLWARAARVRERPGETKVELKDPSAELEATLEYSHRRVDSATPGSPEWDAAQANVDAIEHRIDALRPAPEVSGGHIVARLGPMLLEDGCLIRGMIAAPGPHGDALRHDISGIPDRVHSRDEFVAELERVARQADFVLEMARDSQELSFYAWDRELHSAQSATSDELPRDE